MIRVLFDHQAFSWQQFGGITRYIVELARHLPDDIKPVFPAMLSENAYLDMLPGNMHPKVSSWNFANYRVRKKLYELINSRRSRSIINRGDIDIIHPTYYNPYYLRQSRRPSVITVHDFTHERFPDMLPDSRTVIPNKRRTVMAAGRIIAISESTKRDIMEFYGLPSERIDVIYHGYTPMSVPATVPAGMPPLPHRYILFVGERGRYKNFDTFARAFAAVAADDTGLHLVCAGRTFSPDEIALLRSLHIAGRVTAFRAYGDQLATLYASAIAFIFPSLYEGFGLPVLEAFSAHCPVGLSNTSSLPEVGGDGAFYFDPTSTDDIADTISRLISMTDGERGQLIDRADKRLAQFSWQNTAAATAALYRTLV